MFQLSEFRVKIVIIGFLTFSCGSLDRSAFIILQSICEDVALAGTCGSVRMCVEVCAKICGSVQVYWQENDKNCCLIVELTLDCCLIVELTLDCCLIVELTLDCCLIVELTLDCCLIVELTLDCCLIVELTLDCCLIVDNVRLLSHCR